MGIRQRFLSQRRKAATQRNPQAKDEGTGTAACRYTDGDPGGSSVEPERITGEFRRRASPLIELLIRSYTACSDGEIELRMQHDRGSDGREREATEGEHAAGSRACADEESLQQYRSHDVELRALWWSTTAGASVPARSDAGEYGGT